jgi:hypothetical protein
MAAIQAEGPDVSDGIPQVPINFVPATEGESFALGQISIRVMEDGSRTGMISRLKVFVVLMHMKLTSHFFHQIQTTELVQLN